MIIMSGSVKEPEASAFLSGSRMKSLKELRREVLFERKWDQIPADGAFPATWDTVHPEYVLSCRVRLRPSNDFGNPLYSRLS